MKLVWSFLFSVSVFANEFPYVFTPEKNLPSFQKIRVEGQKKGYLSSPLRMWRYTKKAIRHKFTSVKEMAPYVQKQNLVFAQLENFKPEGESLSLALVGDIMWLRKDWENFLDPEVLQYLNDHKLVFGNLETLVAKSFGVPSFLPARATFNSYPSLVTEFKRQDGSSTFSALSIANNHSLDYGEKALWETLDFLQEQKIPWSGLKKKETDKRYVIIEKQGLRIGFYASTYGMNNRWEEESEVDFNLLRKMAPHDDKVQPDTKEVQEVLKQMATDGVDIKIVSLHWGHEYEHYPEPRQMVFAREVAKAGADIIMGHHSHSQQPMEVCFVNGMEKKLSINNSGCNLEDGTGRARKTLIIYSLGNFISNMYGYLNEVGSIVSVDITKDGWFLPRLKLVQNSKRDPQKKKRKVLFLEDYKQANCFERKACDEDVLEGFKKIENLYPENILKK